MKRISTLFVALVLFFGANAQLNLPKAILPDNGKNALKSKVFNRPQSLLSGERAAQVSFPIDYDFVDEAYATNIGAAYQRFVWDINRRYSNTDNFTLRWAAAIFDSIIAVDYNNNSTAFYPRSSTTMTVDSLTIFHNHQNNTGSFDTLKITIFDTDVFTVTGTGAAANLNTTSIWDTTIITNTSLSANSTNVFDLTLYPGLALAQGQSIGVRVDFAGDTANKFNLLSGYRDECADACAAEPTVAGFNSLFYFNYTIPASGTNISGINSIGLDCDNDGTVGTPGSCEEFYLQNHAIIPFVTANIEYGVAIQAATTESCPGEAIDLVASAYGTAATNISYNWTVSGNGSTLSTTNVADPTLVLGPTGNATVVVEANDGTSSVFDTLVILNRGIAINFGNSNPATLQCGSTLTLSTTLSGYTQGRSYTWSTGATGANVTSQSVNVAGSYSVTVTNNAGCSATNSIVVQYPNNLSNAIDFTLPSQGGVANRGCEDVALDFLNTSARTTGWTYLWEYGDGSNTSFGLNGQYTYNNPGVYNVRLTQDSAGCKFKSSIKPLSVVVCTDINEMDVFANSISVKPNPTNGWVNFSIENVSDNVKVEVYNIIGSVVKSVSENGVNGTFSKSVDLTGLAGGTYMVKFQSGNKTAVKKLNLVK